MNLKFVSIRAEKNVTAKHYRALLGSVGRPVLPPFALICPWT